MDRHQLSELGPQAWRFSKYCSPEKCCQTGAARRRSHTPSSPSMKVCFFRYCKAAMRWKDRHGRPALEKPAAVTAAVAPNTSMPFFVLPSWEQGVTSCARAVSMSPQDMWNSRSVKGWLESIIRSGRARKKSDAPPI